MTSPYRLNRHKLSEYSLSTVLALNCYKLSEYSLSGADGIFTDESLVLSTNTLICTLNGRTFTKINAGWALAAYAYWSNNYTGPVLVSTTANYVAYKPGTYPAVTSGGNVVYDDVTYYYSGAGYTMSGNRTDTSGTGRLRLTNGLTYVNAATELLNRYFHKNGF